MAIRKRSSLKSLGPTEVPALNANLDALFSAKLESRYVRNTSEAKVYSHQVAEHGFGNFSANGSAVTNRTFAFAENRGTIVYANAVAMHSAVRAFVQDVTNCQITIGVMPSSASLTLCAATTATIRVFFQVVGSDS